MPFVFKTLAQETQDLVEVQMQAQGGLTFAWHLSQEAQLRFALMHGDFDYVIFQQAAHSPCPSPEETLSDGKKLIELAKKCGVTPVVTMPWAEKRYPEHQATMYSTFSKLAKENNALLNPVGYVFEKVAKTHPEIDLYWYDGEHCSPYGSYVNALCAYCTIFKKSPMGLPFFSLQHCGGTQDDMLQIQSDMEDLRKLTNGFHTAEMAKPENKKKMDAIGLAYKEKFPTNWNSETLTFELDPKKCEILQNIVWEVYTSLHK